RHAALERARNLRPLRREQERRHRRARPRLHRPPAGRAHCRCVEGRARKTTGNPLAMTNPRLAALCRATACATLALAALAPPARAQAQAPAPLAAPACSSPAEFVRFARPMARLA